MNLLEKVVEGGKESLALYFAIVDAKCCPECGAMLTKSPKCERCGLPYLEILKEAAESLGVI